MTFRKSIVAALAALAIPAFAHAASSGPTREDLARLPGGKNIRAAEAATNVTTKRTTRGAPVDAKEVQADKEFSDAHWQEMQQGVDHMKASLDAAKKG